MNREAQTETVPGGQGPAFPVVDMPAPPADLRGMKLLAMLGPAVIALGGTIGGGEWLVGPSLFVKWGLVLLWITTVSATLQVFLNLEMVRYTIYTGEPITVGFMRLPPGKTFWGVVFMVVGFLERGLARLGPGLRNGHRGPAAGQAGHQRRAGHRPVLGLRHHSPVRRAGIRSAARSSARWRSPTGS